MKVVKLMPQVSIGVCWIETISSEVQGCPLKTTTLTCKLIFQNAEIVDNIHFSSIRNLNDSNQASDVKVH